MEINDKVILIDLYKKHAVLTADLKKVESAILAYGGTISNSSNSTTTPKATYPDEGTWTDKIVYVLTVNGPSTPNEVSDYIVHKEKFNPETTLVTVSQYLSALGREGELKREKEGKKYRYSIK